MIETTADLIRLTADLETVADWKDELAGKIRRAALCFELVDVVHVEMTEIEDLAAEVSTFRSVCHALAATIGRPA
jgi:hypothetical protein